jgi:hypothetical protein
MNPLLSVTINRLHLPPPHSTEGHWDFTQGRPKQVVELALTLPECLLTQESPGKARCGDTHLESQHLEG